MAKYLRPRRGSMKNAVSQNITLQKGEMFLEFTNDGTSASDATIGCSPGRIIIGKGSAAYNTIKYNSTVTTDYRPFITDPSIYVPRFNNTTVPSSGWTISSASSILNDSAFDGSTSGMLLPTMMGKIKEVLCLHDSSITKIKNDLYTDGFSISGGGPAYSLDKDGATFANAGAQVVTHAAGGSTYRTSQTNSTVTINTGVVGGVQPGINIDRAIDSSYSKGFELNDSSMKFYNTSSRTFTVMEPNSIRVGNDVDATTITGDDIIKSTSWGGSYCSTSLNTRLSNAHIVLRSAELRPASAGNWTTATVSGLSNYARAYVNLAIGNSVNLYLPAFKYAGASTYIYPCFHSTSNYAVARYVVDFVNNRIGIYCNNIVGWTLPAGVAIFGIIASENDKL